MSVSEYIPVKHLLIQHPYAASSIPLELNVAAIQKAPSSFIDATGKLSTAIDQKLPHILPETVIAAVQQFLLTPLMDHPQFSTVADLLCAERECANALHMPIHAFKIVGSTVFHLLQSMLKNLLQERLQAYPGAAEFLCTGENWLNLTELPHDGDIRSETHTATIDDLNTRLNQLLNQHSSLETRRHQPAPFAKCIPDEVDGYILVGSGKIDYCLGTEFKRSHLFENSNLQIIIYPDSLTRDASAIKIALFSQGEQGIQAIVDRSLKYLRVRHPQGINYRGATAWISAIVAGYIPVDASVYQILLGKLLIQHEPWGDWGGRIARLITRIAEAHHTADDEAKIALAMQFELSNATSHHTNFKLEYQEFLGRTLWQKLFIEPPLQEPLAALRIKHHLSGQELAALLQIGALLTLSLPTGSGTSAYHITPKAVDGKMAARYTLAKQYHLLVSVSISQLKSVLEQSTLCSVACQSALYAFFDGCHTEATAKEIATLPASLRDSHPALELVVQQQLRVDAQECLASQAPFLHMVGNVLLVALAAMGDAVAEEKLFTIALPQLMQSNTAFSKWGYIIAKALLHYYAPASQHAAIATYLKGVAKGAPTAWWQALLASRYHRYCTFAAQQLAVYLKTSANTGFDDCATLIWFVKATVQYRPFDSAHLLPIWQSSLKALQRLSITPEQAQGLFSCCQYLYKATFSIKMHTGFAVALFHALAEDYPQLALDSANQLLPISYQGYKRLSWYLSASVSLQMAGQSAERGDYPHATVAFKAAWQQLQLAERSPLQAKRKCRRAALSCLQQMSTAEALEIGKDILLAPYSRALLGKSTWELYLNRWLQSCRQRASPQMLASVLPQLLLRLHVRHKQQCLALCQLMRWMLTSDYFPPLSLAEARKLLNACALTSDKNFNWLALVTALEQMHSQSSCEKLFQCPAPNIYAHIALALWQRTGNSERSIQWLKKLPNVITEELAKALLLATQCVYQKADLKSLWEWLYALKSYIEPTQGGVWRALAEKLAKRALKARQDLLAAHIANALCSEIRVEDVFDKTAARRCLMALAHAQSILCLSYLQPISQAIDLLNAPDSCREEGSLTCCNLIEVLLTQKVDQADAIEALYKLMLELQNVAKKALPLQLRCLKAAFKEQAWPLVASISDTILAAKPTASITAKIAPIWLSQIHLCPPKAAAVAGSLLAALDYLQQAQLLRHLSTDQEVAKNIYIWICSVPIGQQSLMHVRDQIALELLALLLQAPAKYVKELPLASTRKLLVRTAQLIINSPYVETIYRAPHLEAVADTKTLAALHHVYVQNIFKIALEAADIQTRIQALQEHARCYPDFPITSPSQLHTQQVVAILVELFDRDSGVKVFEQAVQASFLRIEARRNSASPSTCTNSYFYCHQLFEALVEMSCPLKYTRQDMQLRYLYESLQLLLSSYGTGFFPRPTSIAIFQQITNFYFSAFHLSSEHAKNYNTYVQRLQATIEQNQLLDDTQLHALQLHVHKGQKPLLHLSESQLNKALMYLLKYAENLPYFYETSITIAINSLKYLNAFQTDFDAQYICYTAILDNLNNSSIDNLECIDRYGQIGDLLLCSDKIFGQNRLHHELLLALALHSRYLQEVSQKTITYWNALEKFSEFQLSGANMTIGYLNTLVTAGFLKKIIVNTPTEIWLNYSAMVHICLDLVLAGIKQCYLTSNGTNHSIHTIERQLTNIYDMLGNAIIDISPDQLLSLQQELIRSISLKFLADVKYKSYLQYFLTLCLQGGKPCGNATTLTASTPVECHATINSIQIAAGTSEKSFIAAELIRLPLQQAVLTYNQSSVEEQLANIQSYSSHLQNIELAGTAMNALIYLYIDCDASASLQKYLKFFIELCPTNENLPPYDVTSMRKADSSSFAECYWKYNPRLALYLLLLDGLVLSNYEQIEKRKKALKLAHGLLLQLGKKYAQLSLPLAEAFYCVVTSKLAHCEQLATWHLDALKAKKFSKFSMHHLPLFPRLHLSTVLFLYQGQLDLRAVDIRYQVDNKVEVFEDFIIVLLQHYSWYAFSYACTIAKNYGPTLHIDWPCRLTKFCHRLITRCKELLKIDAFPQHTNDLKGLTDLMYSIDIPGALITILPAIPETYALLHRLSEVLFDHLKTASIDWKEHCASLDHLLGTIQINCEAAKAMGAYAANPELQQEHDLLYHTFNTQLVCYKLLASV